MGTIVGRNCKVEVALTLASAILPTAVTKAYPPVATLSAHALTAGMVGFWSVSAGMVELDQQAIVVSNPLTNTWEMPGLDTADYSTYTAGSLIMAATWGTISEATSYEVGGGAADQLDDTRLYQSKRSNLAGLLAAQDLNIGVKQQEINGTAMQFVERQAQRGLYCLFKISKAGQILRVAYGVPSLPGENVGTGALGEGQFSVTCKQFVLKPNV